jgi:hypothetical protein
MGSFNPFHPIVLGNEFPALVKQAVLLDTATEVGYKFVRGQAGDVVQLCRVMTTEPPPGQPLRKCLTVSIYSHGHAPSTGVVRSMIIPVASGTLGSGASNVGGASVADCVRNPSDTAYTLLSGASSTVRLWFDVNAARVSRALTNARIIDVTVRYAITGPFDTLPDGIVLALERPSATVVFDMDDALTGPANQYDNVVPHRSRLGDLNPFWSTAVNPDANYERAPWHYASGASNHTGLTQLAASGGSNVNVRFATSAGAAGTEWRIQYAALEVTYCAEDRTGAGGLEITTGAVIRNDLFCYDVPIGSMSSWGFDGYALDGFPYDVVVGQGYCGNLSVAYPVPLAVDRISAAAVYGPHEGIVIRKTLRPGEVWTSEQTALIPALALYDDAGSPDASSIIAGSQTYITDAVARTDDITFSDELQARIVDDHAGTYPFVRFYARVQPSTAAELRVSRVQTDGTYVGPTVVITVAELLALPEINQGWRRVTLEWETPLVTTGSGVINIFFESLADSGGPWEVLGADANPFDIATQDIAVPTYGGTTAVARIDDDDDYTADLTVMLIQAMPVPADVDADTAVQPLTLVDESCALPVAAIPTGLTYVTVTWTPDNSDAVAGFDHYEVQRRDTTMTADTWETVATISDVAQGQFDDYEARIGVTSSYRVRFVHVDGYTSAWSSTVTAAITAPGVTGQGVGSSVLVMTTNHNPSGNAAHAMVWSGAGVPAQEFTFVEGDQTVLQQMFQRDYWVAFRPLERGGVEFSRTLLVNALGVPAETLSDGFSGLRDLAWDTVPYVCVRDQLGNRWLTAVSIPTGTVNDVPDAGHLMLAQANFAEVTATPAPIDYTDVCQGLILGPADNHESWVTEVGANALQGVLDATDTFTRVVAAGSWGAADTGETYTLSIAGSSSVNGTRGILTATAANAGLTARMTGTRDFYRAYTDAVPPATATGAAYVMSQLLVCQDQVAFSDNFNRTTSPGWGTATTGQVWAHSDAALCSTTGTRARTTLSSTGQKVSRIDYGRAFAEYTIGRIGLNAAPTGVGGRVVVSTEIARSADGANRLFLNLFFDTGANIGYDISFVQNNVFVNAGIGSGTIAVASSGAAAIRFRASGNKVQAKIWQSGAGEPGSWTIDSTLAQVPEFETGFALVAEKNASVTNVTMYCEWDDVAAVTTDGFDSYRTDLICNTDGTMDMALVARLANLDYTMATTDVPGTYSPGTVVHMDTIVQGFSLDARVWPTGEPEPPHDNIADGSLVLADLDMLPAGGGRYGLRAFRNTSNTNANLAAAFDNLNLYQLPTEFDIRFLIRPVADEWAVDLRVYSWVPDGDEYTGEWTVEVGSSQWQLVILGADSETITGDSADLDLVKNQLTWVRLNFQTDDGTGAAVVEVSTSLDGSVWDVKATETLDRPLGLPPVPDEGTAAVTVYEPSLSAWVHTVEVRADGNMIYDPDFAAAPAGTMEIEDGQGNLWEGEPLCAYL